MREIITHRTPREEGDASGELRIMVLDEPGPGGANHVYGLKGVCPDANTAADSVSDEIAAEFGDDPVIVFQCGNVRDHQVNGVTVEALLAIVADQLEAFQAGPYPSLENAASLAHVHEALSALRKRTLERIKRGVEGQMVA